jgi:hypothetical protein
MGKSTTLPVIAVGDYNFDFDVPSGPGNSAFNLLMQGNVFQWIRPSTLVATQYSDNDDDDENDHNSVLDFVFVAKLPTSWQLTSEILVKAGDFPDNDETSDHRPLFTRVTVGGAPMPVVSADGPAVRRSRAAVEARREATDDVLQSILERLESLEDEVRELRQEVRRAQ